jgi:chemotaxis protein MotB
VRRAGTTPWAGEDEGYLASVSDLMVGLLFVFIIMLMGFALNYRSAEGQADADRRHLLVESVQLATEKEGLAAERDRLAAARDSLAMERDHVAAERDKVAAERDALLAQRDALGLVALDLVARDEARAALLTGVQRALDERALPVTVDTENGVLRLPESLLFDSAAAALRPEGEQALQAIADVLAQVLPCVSHAPPALHEPCPSGGTPLLEALLVEGHTDEVPIRGGGFLDNWQLATARSVNIFKTLTGFRPELEGLRNVRGEALLGVSGYEARRPVAPGTSAEQRRLNRRIDLRFLVAAPAREELAALRRRLDAASGP